MAHFSDVIENGRMNYPMTEKKRCLRAIEEVMSISKGRIGIALPQVRERYHPEDCADWKRFAPVCSLLLTPQLCKTWRFRLGQQWL